MAFGLSFAGGYAKRETERNDDKREAAAKEEAAILAAGRAETAAVSASKRNFKNEGLLTKQRIGLQKEVEMEAAATAAIVSEAAAVAASKRKHRNTVTANELSLRLQSSIRLEEYTKRRGEGLAYLTKKHKPNNASLESTLEDLTQERVVVPKVVGKGVDVSPSKVVSTGVVKPAAVQKVLPIVDERTKEVERVSAAAPVDYITDILGPVPSLKLSSAELNSPSMYDIYGDPDTKVEEDLIADKLSKYTLYQKRSADLGESIQQLIRADIPREQWGSMVDEDYKISDTGSQNIFVRGMVLDYGYSLESSTNLQKDLIQRLNSGELPQDIKKLYEKTNYKYKGHTEAGEHGWIDPYFKVNRDTSLVDASEVVSKDLQLKVLSDEEVSILEEIDVTNPQSVLYQSTNIMKALATGMLEGHPQQFGDVGIDEGYSSIRTNIITPFIDAVAFNSGSNSSWQHGPQRRGARDLMGSSSKLKAQIDALKDGEVNDDGSDKRASLTEEYEAALFHKMNILRTAEYAAKSTRGWESWKTAIKRLGGTEEDITGAILGIRDRATEIALSRRGGMEAAKEYIAQFNDNRPFQVEVVQSIMALKEGKQEFVDSRYPDGLPTPGQKPVLTEEEKLDYKYPEGVPALKDKPTPPLILSPEEEKIKEKYPNGLPNPKDKPNPPSTALERLSDRLGITDALGKLKDDTESVRLVKERTAELDKKLSTYTSYFKNSDPEQFEAARELQLLKTRNEIPLENYEAMISAIETTAVDSLDEDELREVIKTSIGLTLEELKKRLESGNPLTEEEDDSIINAALSKPRVGK